MTAPEAAPVTAPEPPADLSSAAGAFAEAAERAREAAGARKHRVGGQTDVLQHELTGHRGAQRDLVPDVVPGEAGGAGRDEETADTVVGDPRGDYPAARGTQVDADDRDGAQFRLHRPETAEAPRARNMSILNNSNLTSTR